MTPCSPQQTHVVNIDIIQASLNAASVPPTILSGCCAPIKSEQFRFLLILLSLMWSTKSKNPLYSRLLWQISFTERSALHGHITFSKDRVIKSRQINISRKCMMPLNQHNQCGAFLKNSVFTVRWRTTLGDLIHCVFVFCDVYTTWLLFLRSLVAAL